MLAIVLAVTGGVAWTYAVIQRGYIFSPAEKVTASRKGGGGSITLLGGGGGGGGRSKYIDRSGGSEPDLEDDQATDEGTGSWGGSIVTAALGDRGHGGSGLDLGWISARSRSARPEVHENDGEIKQDCLDCPEMLIVAGGSVTIGAPETDLQASASEMPARLVRLWPGFAISRKAIAAHRFSAAKAALLLPDRACAGPAPDPSLHAVCMTASDAEAFAAWLTQRSGKRYRLPTAIEWEFARSHARHDGARES